LPTKGPILFEQPLYLELFIFFTDTN
jgi:hypothetical protein